MLDEIQAASTVVREFLDAMRRHRFANAVTLIEPSSAERFADSFEGLARTGLGTREAINLRAAFGDPDSPDVLDRMSPNEFVERWMDYERRKDPDVYHRFRDAQVLGAVAESAERAYVVVRFGEDTRESVPVMLLPVTQSDSRWRVTIREGIIVPDMMGAFAFEQ